MTNNVLHDKLRRAGKVPRPAAFPDGSRLLVLPDSGRLLGLYSADGDANFFWTNPELAEAGSATAYFNRTGWPNPGGDRTWLAPELDLFVGDPARPFETYAVPPALDPGNWQLVAASAVEVRLENQTRLRLHRPEREVGVRLGRCVSPAANPLAGGAAAPAGLEYAGYTLVTTVELEPVAAAPVRLGIWNLLQLPQPGTLLIPTRAPARPHVVFGALSAAELTAAPRLVRWHMAPPGGDAKISIKALPLTGRAGYWRETGTPGIQELVVREFAVGPERDYVDAAWAPPHETGWAFQACCVRNGPERFNELEYHAPAATAVAGQNVSRDESRVWAFRGPQDAIETAVETLLGECKVS